MKHEPADRVSQVQIAFTNKRLTVWRGACAVIANFLEQIQFREGVVTHVPIEETSPNAKGIYEKVLALLLTNLSRRAGWW